MIPFLDLKAQYQQMKPEIDAAITRAIDSTQFVLGPEVEAFEERFASYCNVRHCVAVNSGTSALHLALLAASLLMLPAIPNTAWKPTGGEDPTLRIFGLLGATIGLPYFLLSTTSPLVQAWFWQRFRHTAPYRLFALSNFASLLALPSGELCPTSDLTPCAAKREDARSPGASPRGVRGTTASSADLRGPSLGRSHVDRTSWNAC